LPKTDIIYNPLSLKVIKIIANLTRYYFFLKYIYFCAAIALISAANRDRDGYEYYIKNIFKVISKSNYNNKIKEKSENKLAETTANVANKAIRPGKKAVNKPIKKPIAKTANKLKSQYENQLPRHLAKVCLPIRAILAKANAKA